MKNYFRLHPYAKLVKGQYECAIYNTLEGKVYSITNKQYHLLNKCEKNESIKFLSEEDKNFIFDLLNKNLGIYYDNPTYIDGIFYGMPSASFELIQKNGLNRLFIELTNQCNLNCKFCEPTNTLYRKTGCKRWNTSLPTVSIDKWKDIILSAKNLGCKKFIIIGGEPFIEFEKLKKIVDYIQPDKTVSITIFTNGILLNQSNIIEFIKENNIHLCIQIFSDNKETYSQITNCSTAFDIFSNNLDIIQEKKIKHSLHLLINKFNENEVSRIHDTYHQSPIRDEFIYPVQNDFYSKKFINQIYDKSNSFIKPTLDNFNLFTKYNPCYKGTLAIACDGTIYPCPMSRKLPLGHIKKRELYEILKSDLYKTCSTLHKDKITGCSACDRRYICFDCRALEMSATNDIHGVKFCNLLKRQHDDE